jgi:UDP-GlcNAc3NAcA epimerase
LKKKRIVTVVGARPQFIKAAALSKAIVANHEIEEILVHTGQHFDENMSDIFFSEMQIPQPKYQFSIHGLNHGAMTGRMIEKIEEVLLAEKPDTVLVYGDTNSTLAGALAAKKLKIKVAHVEAGLRSYNMGMPEEINRILTDRISDYLFCPTEKAIANLMEEGFANFNTIIKNSGDIMFDSMLLFSNYIDNASNEVRQIATDPYILCTLHRAENTDDGSRLNQIFSALNVIAEETNIILPLHPRTKQKISGIKLHPNLKIIDPVGYFEMLYLLKSCHMVMTDSGGLQKEAFFNRKFCVTLRDETEWTELVDSDCNVLAGANTETIISKYNNFKNLPFTENRNFYGDGRTAQYIIETLLEV